MEQEASRMAEAMGKASIEVAVAAKMEAHHRTRAADREQARRDLREKADAQVSATVESPRRRVAFGKFQMHILSSNNRRQRRIYDMNNLLQI